MSEDESVVASFSSSFSLFSSINNGSFNDAVCVATTATPSLHTAATISGAEATNLSAARPCSGSGFNFGVATLAEPEDDDAITVVKGHNNSNKQIAA